jgi:rhodanese-related sulfurtransferase
MNVVKTVKIITAIITGIFISHCSPGNTSARHPAASDTPEPGQNVSVQTVAALRGKKDVIVLDVREPSEYRQIHIPGAVLIPLKSAVSKKAEYINYKTVLVTCRSGNRSGQVVNALRSQGYTNVHNMTGGLNAWIRAGLPTEP